MRAKACDDLVKDQGRTRLWSYLSHLLEKCCGLQGGMAALDWFNQDSRQLMRMFPDKGEGLRGTVVQDHDVLRFRLGYPRGDRDGARGSALADSFHQHFVKGAVIGTRKHHYLVPPGYRAGETQRRHDRFRTSVAKGDALHGGKLADQLCYFPCQR